MFLEKHARFFRRYELQFTPRHKNAPSMPLIAGGDDFSVLDALKNIIRDKKATEAQSNTDLIELIDADFIEKRNALVLLFHRASPNAADPTYRKRHRERISIRTAVKDSDEEQSVSAHLVIDASPIDNGRYQAALEEIPGLSMAAVAQIIRQALNNYSYDFRDQRGNITSTYCMYKAFGIKSETITNALKTGHLKTVTLTRPARPDFVDADGIFEPTTEIMKLKVRGDFDNKTWAERFKSLAGSARNSGWDEVSVDIDLGDKRSRTVALERDQEAKEILFVRSSQINFVKPLSVCSTEIQSEIVAKALDLIQDEN